jgi:putative PIN family toxin of toxin-antitoxin system
VIKVVFDTVVFVHALLNSRSIPGRLIYVLPDRYRLILSPPVVAEILEVLGRAELVARFHLRDVDYAEALARLLDAMRQAETVELGAILPISRDPKDDKFLATAEMAEADYVVSEDLDLLVLKEYKGIHIVDCATFLKLLEEDLAG